MSRAKVSPAQAPECRQCALIKDFLDLLNLSIRHALDLGPTRKVAAAEPDVGHQDGPMSNLPKNLTADAHYAIHKFESVGSGKQLMLHRNPSASAREFYR